MTSRYIKDAVADLVLLGQKSGGGLYVSAWNVHGVKIRVATNSSKAAGVISKFLGHFEPYQWEKFDIVFHLFFVDALEDDMSSVAQGASTLYDWGMLKVYHKGSCRYLEVDSRARVTADLERSTAAGFAEKGLLESDWLVSNMFFYPLLAQLLKEHGLFPLHAAGLVKKGRASLFLGKSGSGKSTLSLNLVRGGFKLLSDDTVFIRERGDKVDVLSFPEEINIREETIKLLPELSRVKKFNVDELRQKSSFHIEELYPGCIVDEAVPAVMVFPEITENGSTSVEPISGTEALSESLKYGFFFLDPSTTKQHFRVMSALAKQVQSFRLYSGNDQKGLEQAVSALLNGGGEDKGQIKQ